MSVDSMSPDSIYKIQFLDNKDGKLNINKIFVFRGNVDNNEDKLSYFNEDEKQKITDIDLSLDNIHLINEYIFPDDSIKTIKLKVIMNSDKKLSYDEIYMFSSVLTNINIKNIFTTLSQNDKFEITPDKLKEYLYNIKEIINVEHLTNNDDGSRILTYDDLVSINIDENKKYTKYIPLGHHFTSKYKYIYSVVPFTPYLYDTYLLDNIDDLVKTCLSS